MFLFFNSSILLYIVNTSYLYCIYPMTKFKKTPQELIGEAWNDFKDAWIQLLHSTGKTIRWIYKTLDALDKNIGQIWSPANNKIVDFTKNNLIKILLIGSLVTYWWIKTHDYLKNKITKDRETHVSWNSNELVYVTTKNYPAFRNKKITKSAPLTKHYLWLDVSNRDDIIIWDTLVLHPWKTLHDLRANKLLKYGKKNIIELDTIDVATMTNEEQALFRTKYPIDATYVFNVRPYIEGKVNKTQVSIEEFTSLTEKTIRKTEKDIESYDGALTGKRLELLRIIKQELPWKSILAYAMTELCENKEDWHINTQLFNLLLQNTGIEFLSLIPAMYDPKTSYWIYQFTEYALYDTPKEKRWASVVNKYILDNNNKLPGSVMYLNNWESQTKAAYMFAIYNVALGLGKLTDNEADLLLLYYKKNTTSFIDNITQLIAMCHHRPVDNKALKKWIQDGFKKDIYTYGSAKTYGKASKANYEWIKLSL